MPDIDANVWAPYRDDGVLVYGLHSGESPQQIADFIEQTGVTYPVVLDEQGTRLEFSFPSGVGYPYPRDVVIGKDLTVHSIRNSFNVEEVRELIERLLAE